MRNGPRLLVGSAIVIALITAALIARLPGPPASPNLATSSPEALGAATAARENWSTSNRANRDKYLTVGGLLIGACLVGAYVLNRR